MLVLPIVRPIAAAFVVSVMLPAQSSCPGYGSTYVAARAQPSPLPLGCARATIWPMWHLLLPPHRAPAAHRDHRPGHARALPTLIVTYRCTGWLLLPVVPTGVRTMGYVIDQAEHACY